MKGGESIGMLEAWPSELFSLWAWVCFHWPHFKHTDTVFFSAINLWKIYHKKVVVVIIFFPNSMIWYHMTNFGLLFKDIFLTLIVFFPWYRVKTFCDSIITLCKPAIKVMILQLPFYDLLPWHGRSSWKVITSKSNVKGHTLSLFNQSSSSFLETCLNQWNQLLDTRTMIGVTQSKTFNMALKELPLKEVLHIQWIMGFSVLSSFCESSILAGKDSIP